MVDSNLKLDSSTLQYFCHLLESGLTRINWIQAVDKFCVEQLISCQKCRANDCRAIEFRAVHPHSNKPVDIFQSTEIMKNPKWKINLPVPGIEPGSASDHALRCIYCWIALMQAWKSKIDSSSIWGLRPYPLGFHVEQAVSDTKLIQGWAARLLLVIIVGIQFLPPQLQDYSTLHGAWFLLCNFERCSSWPSQ